MIAAEELSDQERIAMIRAGHDRYKRRQEVSETAIFTGSDLGNTSRAGFDLNVATEIVSPGEWPSDLDLGHLELDEEDGE